jgi:hypothetical protein
MKFLLKIEGFQIPIYRTFVSAENINNDGITICSLSYYKYYNKELLLENKYPNPIILANTEEEYEDLNDNYDMDFLFCNHNAFLNENNYTIIDNKKKKYDMVVNSKFHIFTPLHI